MADTCLNLFFHKFHLVVLLKKKEKEKSVNIAHCTKCDIVKF